MSRINPSFISSLGIRVDEIDAHDVFDVWILHFSAHSNGGRHAFLEPFRHKMFGAFSIWVWLRLWRLFEFLFHKCWLKTIKLRACCTYECSNVLLPDASIISFELKGSGTIMYCSVQFSSSASDLLYCFVFAAYVTFKFSHITLGCKEHMSMIRTSIQVCLRYSYYRHYHAAASKKVLFSIQNTSGLLRSLFSFTLFYV